VWPCAPWRQVEVSFRDATACRNALLLFTALVHGLLEQQLANAFKELGAKRAEVRALRGGGLWCAHVAHAQGNVCSAAGSVKAEARSCSTQRAQHMGCRRVCLECACRGAVRGRNA
jgi:hypothetical protein